MPEISTAKSPVQRGKTSVQKKDRLLGAIFAGAKTFMGAVARAMYALWLQASGLIYVMFTVLAGSYLFKQYRANHYHLANTRPFWQVGAFFVVCLWFTVVSFWRAQKTMKGKRR